MTRTQGLSCVVTGAASGIGHAVTEQLVKDGATVASLDRNEPASAVDKHVSVDLADPASIDRAAEELGAGWDALLNVAGLPGTASSELVFRVNFLGLRHLTESFFERLSPGGAIVNVSSVAGFNWPARLETIKELMATGSYEDGLRWFHENPQEGNTYNFAKEAVTVYTMMMACGLVQQDLRMNAVLPGPVETPILPDFEESMGKDNLDGIKGLLGRHASPADIASAVIFLASPESRWINGHPLVADGGISGAVLTGMVPPPEF